MENNEVSAHLKWDSKTDENKKQTSCSIHEVGKVLVNPVRDLQSSFEEMAETVANPDKIDNCYYYADNYELLKKLAADSQKIDLIYIDPPYMTDLDYHSTISIGSYADIKRIRREAFNDRWSRGLDSYLDMLYPRLRLMREVLARHGSIFVHVDWHASHYVRVLLDEVFGRDNFVNEIVWCFGGGSASRKYFHRKHDLIFWYARSQDYIYNTQHRPYTQGTLQRGLTNVKRDRYKLDENGALMQDWWVDINKILSPTARENLKFPTQKPKELLKRIIASASRPGARVADFFSGSGTTAEVCNEINRNWILCDSSKLALQTSLYRLISTGSPPFTICADVSYPGENESGSLILKKPVVRKSDDKDYLIDIGIESFWPANINIKEQKSARNFADYIEFWEVDLDFDGKVFHSNYQMIRERQRFKEPITLDIMVRVKARENLKIAIRVYDVFANNAMGVISVNI